MSAFCVSDFCGFFSSASNADLIDDPNITAITTTGTNHGEYGHLDTGWSSKNNKSWEVDSSGAGAIRKANKGSLYQLDSVGAHTGDDFTLCFDWTAAAGATGQDLLLSYSVVAWDDGGAPAAADEMFRFVNGSGSTGSAGVSAGGSGIDLLTGSTFSGNTTANQINTATGTAGSLTTVQIGLNFGGLQIENYDFIGIRFDTDEGFGVDGIIGGATIKDNSAAVPEPSSSGLIGLGIIALFGLRRRNT